MTSTSARVDARSHAGAPIDLVGFARPHEQEEVCGDVFLWTVTPERVTVLVADGLGHGPGARAAAERARECVLEAPEDSPDRLLRRCHTALQRTRGAALAIAQVDTKHMNISFCGVGNVSLRETPTRGGRGTSIPGIVGLKLPQLRVFESKLRPDDIVVLHTDGIRANFETSSLRKYSFEDLAREMTTVYGVPYDDAAAVALRVHTASASMNEEPDGSRDVPTTYLKA